MGDGKKREDKDKQQTSGQVVWEYIQAIILAVALALFVRSFVLQAFHIPSGSMIPTFLEGDRVLVTKYSYGIRNPFNNKVWIETGSPERWDVIIFIYPEDNSKDFVKRVVGLPGETVKMINGDLYINGVKTEDPHANYASWGDPNNRNIPEVTVGEGQYFVLGDNRDNSRDSRYWGTVDSSLLKGKAWRLYWSWDSSDRNLSLSERFRGERIGRKIE